MWAMQVMEAVVPVVSTIGKLRTTHSITSLANTLSVGRDTRGDAHIVSCTDLQSGLSGMDPMDRDRCAVIVVLHLSATSDFHHGRRIYTTLIILPGDDK